MSIEVVTDPKLIDRIEAERATSEMRPYIDILVKRFEGLHIQEIGGAVRDIIVNEMYGTSLQFRDWDLIIDDSQQEVDLFGRCEGLSGEVGKNKYGNVKWRVGGFEFDVTKYSTRANKSNPVALESFLRECDFNIGALAYCWEHEKLFSFRALDGIRNREIEVMNPEEDRPQATIVRAINFERKLDFRLGQQTVDYIRATYTPALEKAIKDYVAYKGMPQSVTQKVMNRLAEITK